MSYYSRAAGRGGEPKKDMKTAEVVGRQEADSNRDLTVIDGEIATQHEEKI